MRALAISAAILLAPAAAHATVAIETVYVSGARLQRPVGDDAFSNVLLESRDLASDRLDASLEQVPGVSLFRRTSSISANPTTQGISMRAIAPSGAGRALVLLDGVPMNDPFGGWVIWTQLPSEDIESAEITRGAGAGPYGAGALTGTILLSETDTDTPYANLTAGSLGKYRFGAVDGGDAGDIRYSGSISGERSNGWIPVRPPERGLADNHLWFDGGSASLRAQTFIGDIDTVARIGIYDQAQGAGVLNAESRARGFNASLAFDKPLPWGDQQWRVQAWATKSALSNTSASVTSNRDVSTPANDQYATPALGYGMSAMWMHPTGHFRWEAGGDLRVDSGASHELYRFVSGDFTMNRVAGGKEIITGLYAEGAYKTNDWLLTAGVRADYWATSQGHLVERVRASGAIANDQDYAGRSGAVPTGRIGLRRDFSDQYLRAAFYVGFRVPTLNELYRPFRVGNNTTNANAALKPETLSGAEIGWGGKDENFTWNMTGFWNRLHDAITNRTLSSSPSGSVAQRQNIGDVDALGIEGDAAYEIEDVLILRGAFSITDARVHTDDPDLNGKRPAQAPRATITAGVKWHPFDPLYLGTHLDWESARFEDDRNTLRLGSAVAVEFDVKWKFSNSLGLTASLGNAFNAKIATAEATDGTISYDAPRTFALSLNYSP